MLAPSLTAQNVARVAPLPSPLQHAGTFHVATGEWTRAQQTYGIPMQDVLYRNDIASGYFGPLDQSEIAYDEGRLPGALQPLAPGGSSFGTRDSYLVQGFQFAYCSSNCDFPATISVGFFERYAPCTHPAGLPIVAEFTTTGLPDDGCWTIAIDLTGTTGEFSIDAEGGDGTWDNDNASDDFGYSITYDVNQGDGSGGFCGGLVLAGDLNNAGSIGDGTAFQNPGNSGTGLGTEDLSWWSSPVVADGCYFYGGCLPCANFHMVLFGYGERCVGGGGIVRYGPFNAGSGASNMFDATVDMSFSGNSNIQYWFRDPANAATCGATFNLSNGMGF